MTNGYFDNEDEMFALCANKSFEEIQEMYNRNEDEAIVRQAIRYSLSRLLMDTDEDNRVNVDVLIDDDETFGLSSLQMPNIVNIYQEPCEGYILCHIYGSDDDIDIDDLDTTTQMDILYCVNAKENDSNVANTHA